MKYPSLKNKGIKKYGVTSFGEGIAQSHLANDTSLSRCENIYNLDGRLAVRTGFIPTAEQYQIPSDQYLVKPLYTTETVYVLSGENCRLAYMITSDGQSTDYAKIYLANGESGYKAIGEITFRRITSSQFYRPSNIYFIVGNPTTGSGIYAFVTKKTPDSAAYEIYEANANLDSWVNVTQRAYVPTIYANGRGTQFTASQNYDDSLDYPDPVEPEPRNLLTGCFRAYFSSDRISYMFKLPLSNLDDNVVTCRVYSTPKNYTDWALDIGRSSNTATFLGEEITFHCNKKTGYFWFKKGDYSYTIPTSNECPFNNIVITAHKMVENGMDVVIGSKNAIIHNSRVYAYGNEQKPNEVFSATLSNLLYFPENAKATIGGSTNGVTALGIQSGKLIAFKAAEIYKINVSKNSTKSVNIPIFDKETSFGREDVLESQAVHTGIGCDCPDTLKLCGNRLMWLNSNGTVYTLATTTYGKQNNIYEVSSPIAQMLEEISFKSRKNAFAIENNGYYILVFDTKAFVMNYRVNALGYYNAYPKNENEPDSVAWYTWRLPQDAIFASGFYSGGRLLINATDPKRKICYVLTASGNTDKLLFVENDEVVEKEYAVNGALSTQRLDFGLPQQYKYINAIYITANSSEAVEITVEGDSASYKKRVRLPKMVGTVRITPHIKSTVAVKITVKTKGEFSLYGIRFEYTPCSKVR